MILGYIMSMNRKMFIIETRNPPTHFVQILFSQCADNNSASEGIQTGSEQACSDTAAHVELAIEHSHRDQKQGQRYNGVHVATLPHAYAVPRMIDLGLTTGLIYAQSRGAH